MVAEMTGPNGCFRPRSQQQQRQTESQPLLEQRGMRQPSDSKDGEEKEQSSTDPAMGPSSSLTKATGKAPERRGLRDAFSSSTPTMYEPDNATAGYKSADLVVEGPSDVHPALRTDDQVAN